MASPLQVHARPRYQSYSVVDIATPSLVDKGIIQPKPASIPTCESAGWLRGVCEHGTTRWIRLRCKRRTCEVCGEERRRMIAWRISHGIEVLGRDEGAAWFVGTFAKDVPKVDAVKTQGKFVRWLRKELGYQVEYAATWEVTKAGRLHLNLILAPWKYIPQKRLSEKWRGFGGGPVVWVQWVSPGIGVEAAKARQSLGAYLGKWEQMVKTGRGVAYSKGWPKLPENPIPERKGKISWQWVGELSQESALFWYERELGHWLEVCPGEWAFTSGEDCACFERGSPYGFRVDGSLDWLYTGPNT